MTGAGKSPKGQTEDKWRIWEYSLLPKPGRMLAGERVGQCPQFPTEGGSIIYFCKDWAKHAESRDRESPLVGPPSDWSKSKLLTDPIPTEQSLFSQQ